MLINKEQQVFLSKEESQKFLVLINKISKEKSDPKDLQEAEYMISQNQDLWKVGMGVAGSTLDQFIEKITTDKAQQILTKAEAMSIKERLGYDTAPQLEKLIIDQIMLCWASINCAEVNHKMQSAFSNIDGKDSEESLSQNQRRYFKAIETLARIRKINNGISLQLNIATDGGKQVNINNK